MDTFLFCSSKLQKLLTQLYIDNDVVFKEEKNGALSVDDNCELIVDDLQCKVRDSVFKEWYVNAAWTDDGLIDDELKKRYLEFFKTHKIEYIEELHNHKTWFCLPKQAKQFPETIWKDVVSEYDARN